MKKIAILSAVNIKHMSLITLYTEILKKYKIQFDIIYMDKYGEEEQIDCHNKYRYLNIIKPEWPSLKKQLKYMRFVPYAINILNKNKYDFVIVWNDVAIFMFADYLSCFYKKRYCLNVRDNMYYDKKILKIRYARVFRNSRFNTVSSKGYLDFLPKGRGISYFPINSLNISLLNGMHIHDCLRKDCIPIKIGFIGYVRFFERNKMLLDVFANDNRFELHYYGKQAHKLQEYARERGYYNTAFHDGFPIEDTKLYLEKIDILNNLYGNDTLNLRKAISIKFFHALYAKIPILVSNNTYVGSEAKKIGIGFEVDDCSINEKLPDRIFEWYEKLDFIKISKKCDEYLEKAKAENEKLRYYLEDVINN